MEKFWLYISICGFVIAAFYLFKLITYSIFHRAVLADRIKSLSLKNILSAAKAFIAEYELFTIPLFFVAVLFSYGLISKVFFMVPADVKAPPNVETFYYALRTLLIAFGFLLVKWLWFKRDSPQSAERMKEGWIKPITEASPYDQNSELIYANAKWFLYLFWLALIALAVFP